MGEQCITFAYLNKPHIKESNVDSSGKHSHAIIAMII